MQNTEQRLVKVFETVFPDLPAQKIPGATQETVDTWDSIAAITLINLIEEEFGIEMDLDQAAELTSFSSILEYVNERTAKTVA